MNQTQAVIGAQWGDEGKGKIADRLAKKADWVVRYQGGNNAGHTVIVDGEKYVLHLVPSGILHSGTRCVIGSGMVVNLRELVDEMEKLKKAGISVDERLCLSYRAHVLFPFHQYLDSRAESQRGEDKIGTTQKGIGPAYQDKISRDGIRLIDLEDPDRVKEHCEHKIKSLDDEWHEFEDKSAHELAEEYIEIYRTVRESLIDGQQTLNEAQQNGDTILFEGAQGTLLDIDFGTYPYVTSSNSTVGGTATGSGLPGHKLESVIGVSKAYVTRVGKGPFPVELTGDIGDEIREKGDEFGATTGRPRRCGWLDLNLLKYACEVNGFTTIALTKLDVLSGLDSLKVATDYTNVSNGPDDHIPVQAFRMDGVEPVYKQFDGWDEDISDCRNWSDLPVTARDYVEFIEDFIDVPINYLSVGPGRNELIFR